MAKICDNKSVGQIIRDGEKIVLIERKNYPESYALPAGHVDADINFADAAIRESQEEVGVTILENKMVFREDIDNPCKREGGSHHLWEVYDAVKWNGELKASSDAKSYLWADTDALIRLARRTEYFIQKYGIPYTEVGKLTVAIFGADPNLKTTDLEWKAEMGLEPVWYYILKEHILGSFEII